MEIPATFLSHRRYALISAVRNEERYLGELVRCVASQSILPARWVIVDDGSSDLTHRIATDAALSHPFISVVQMPASGERSFSSQVYAARHGYETIQDLEFEYVGFLDADIRMEPAYYEHQMRAMDATPEIGLAGGALMDQHEGRVSYVRKGAEDYHVPGGVQFFRRACFDKIGGYQIIDGGGQDTIADVMAMMHGWKVRVIPETIAIHLRPEGVNARGAFHRGMRWGRKFYLLGYHPIYFLAQSARRWKQTPVLLASLFQLFGFAAACARREARPVSGEFVSFLRALQMRRLRCRVLGRSGS